jgi:hypothetical protein
MVIVLVTMIVLMLMWSAAYRTAASAVVVETAARERSQTDDGPRQAAARALEWLEAGQVPSGFSRYRTSVTTSDGTFDYAVTFQSVGKRHGNGARWQIKVTRAGSGADSGWPVL